MKSKSSQRLVAPLSAVLLSLVGFASSARAQTATIITPGTTATVTLGFVVSSTAENEVKEVKGNEVHSGVIEKTNYTTKAFLQDLIDQEYIPGPLAGWKIELVNPEPLSDEGERVFYAVKAGVTPVRLSSSVLRLAGEMPGYAESYSESYNSEGVLVSAKTTAMRQPGGLAGTYVVDGAEFSMVGLLSGSDKTGPVKIGSQTFFFYYTLNSAKISGLVGSLDDSEDPEGDDLVMEGTFSVLAEKPRDISTYLTNFKAE